MHDTARTPWPERLMLVATLCVAWALRVYGWGALPHGLAVDEGHNGLDAYNVLRGLRPLFFATDNGREPLFIYSASPWVGLLGPTPAALRLAAAAWGLLAVAATYAAARQLCRRRAGAGVAPLAAAALMATSFWPVAGSRIGVEAMVLPTVIALAVTLYVAALRRGGLARAALAGGLFAACAYAHPAGRVAVAMPLLHQLVMGLAAFARRARGGTARLDAARPRVGRRRLARASVFAAAYLLAVLPLAGYFAAHPDQFFARLERAQALEGDDPAEAARDLAENAWRLALTAAVRGDNQWSHNLPGRPLLTGLGALGLWVALAAAVIGGASALLRRRQPRGPPWSPLDPTGRAALGCWLVVMLLPAWLSGSGRDFARAGGALPAVMIVAGLGLDLVAEGAARAWSRRPRGAVPAGRSGRGATRLGPAVAALTLFAGATSTAVAYARYLRAPEVAAIFQGRLTEQGERIAQLARDATVFVPPAFTERAVTRYLTSGRDILPMAPEFGVALPLSDARPVVYAGPVDGEGSELLTALGNQWFPKQAAESYPRCVGSVVAGSDGAPVLATLPVTPAGHATALLRWPGMRSVDWRLANGVVLVAARIDAWLSDRVDVTLVWLTNRPLPADRTVFVHLRAADGTTLAQADAMPWDNALPTSSWPARTLVVDRHVVPLDPADRDRVTSVAVGLYDVATGERETDGAGANEWVLALGEGAGPEE